MLKSTRNERDGSILDKSSQHTRHLFSPIEALTAAAAPPPGVGCFFAKADTNWPMICLEVLDDIRTNEWIIVV